MDGTARFCGLSWLSSTGVDVEAFVCVVRRFVAGAVDAV